MGDPQFHGLEERVVGLEERVLVKEERVEAILAALEQNGIHVTPPPEMEKAEPAADQTLTFGAVDMDDLAQRIYDKMAAASASKKKAEAAAAARLAQAKMAGGDKA